MPTPANGWCINIAPGVYLQSGTLTINKGGNLADPAGYLVYRCSTMPFAFSGGALTGEGSGCVIKSNSSNANLISRAAGSSYVMMDAVELDGNNFQSYGDCIDSVVGGNNGDGSGTHHFWIINSSWHHCGQSGLQLNNSEFFYVIHNVWHDNALCSAGGGAPCTNSQGVWGSGLSSFSRLGMPDIR